MDEIKEELRGVIAAAYIGAVIELNESVPGRKVGGSVIAVQFDGQEQIDRQRALWDTLRHNLGSRLVYVGTILTLTPQEVAAMQEAA
jgi:acid stress-induced BolA-like protein IbaG/YrbA